MDWLNNANTIASLVMAMIGIGGSLYGIITYLKKKASSIPRDAADDVAQPAYTPSEQHATSLPPLTWMDWAEMLAGGLVDFTNFVLNLCFQHTDIELDEISTLARVGLGLGFCGIGLLIGMLILGILMSILLSGFGIQNSSGAAGVIAFILLFSLLSFVYVYHVGRRIEQKRKEQYQSQKRQRQMHSQQSVQR